MTSELQRALGFFAAFVALGLVAAVLAPRLLRRVSGPEGEVITYLKRLEAEGFSTAVRGASSPLASRSVRFDRLSVRVEPGGSTAVALATLDFEGALGSTEVSSLGVEQVPFRDGGGWAPSEGPAPRLAAIVAALERRRRLLHEGTLKDLLALDPRAADDPALKDLLSLRRRTYRAEAWYLRAERDDVVVSEAYRVQGDLPDRPLDLRGKRRLTLVRKGGEFIFPNGLM